MPARSRAWLSVSTVKTPKITGTPVSICVFIRACVTESHMYSKCMVEPLISTPMAITASKGPVLLLGDGATATVGSSKLAVEAPSRSFADDKVLFCIWEATIILGQRGWPQGCVSGKKEVP